MHRMGREGRRREKSGFGFLERVAQVRLFWREAPPFHGGIGTSTNSMCLLYLIHTTHVDGHGQEYAHTYTHTNSKKSKSQPNLFPHSTMRSSVCRPSSTKICIDNGLYVDCLSMLLSFNVVWYRRTKRRWSPWVFTGAY